MNTEKIDEIIKILRTIADTSTSNKIALLSVLLSAIAVGSSIYFSYKTETVYRKFKSTFIISTNR